MKYGVKILTMRDERKCYMVNATPEGLPVAEYYKSIHGTNRNCTFDNWFTSDGPKMFIR